MSTRTYNLRTRADTGVANQYRTRDEPTVRRFSPSPVRDPPPHMLGRNPATGLPTLYSDVVASRSPSPSKEDSSTSAAHTRVGPDNEGITISHLGPEERAVHTNDNNNIERVDNFTSHDESVSPQDQGDAPWTTVQRRRMRSLGSLDRARNRSDGSSAKGLTLDQIQVVNAAASALTNSQRKTFHEREKRTTHRRESSSSSRGEGTSKRKGKTIDPREWGNVNISQESLDVEAQIAAFKSLPPKKTSKSGKGGRDKKDKKTH